MPAAFDLTRNPFHVLGVSAGANEQEIANAHETALARGRAAQDSLARARQTILTPQTRIEAELAWLQGTSHSHAAGILSKLERGNKTGAEDALALLHGLDKANLAADLCIRSGGQLRHVRQLLDAYEDVTEASVLETLATLRDVSGLPAPEPEDVKAALANLMTAHADAAIACLSRAPSPPTDFARIADAYRPRGNGNIDGLLNRIGSAYNTWIEPRRLAVIDRIKTSIATCKLKAAPVPVDDIVKLLEQWRALSRPAHLPEAVNDREDPLSAEIYSTVRSFCIWLAGTQQVDENALMIAMALEEVFPDLPAVADELRRSNAAEGDGIGPAAFAVLPEPLAQAVQGALQDIPVFAADLREAGFSPKSIGLAKTLYSAFADAATLTQDTDDADRPWIAVRSLAAVLRVDRRWDQSALLLVRDLLMHDATTPIGSVKQRLEADIRALSHANLSGKQPGITCR